MSDLSDDERLALEFLNAELPPNSDLEYRAREALVRLLLDEAPLNLGIRMNLAWMFDPEFSKDSEQLVIHIRRRGRKQTAHDNMAGEVAEAIRRGSKVDVAVADVAKKYKVSERTVWRARQSWSRD
jgi:hypothetical protein